MKQCKDDANESRMIPFDVNMNIKRMAMEQGLYTQVVKLIKKYFKCISAHNEKNEAKFKFQYLSARSQRWFDLDFDWNEINFSTCDPDSYKEKNSKT